MNSPSKGASVTAAATVVRELAPGVLISALVAGLAVAAEAPLRSALGALTGRPLALPAMVIALMLGVALNRLAARPVFAAGIAFCVRRCCASRSPFWSESRSGQTSYAVVCG